jgi:aldehyde dehydrogenase (NAD+)
VIGWVADADVGAGAVAQACARAHAAFLIWRSVPAPRRGQLVRAFGEVVRSHSVALAALITLEAGKSPSEALGEVQEVVDICEFAVGLSRQLHGLTIASERPGHTLREVWQPLGPVGVISAFNFPMAVWAWNAALALVCGNPVVWKPSEKTPLCALALGAILDRVCEGVEGVPEGLCQVLTGGADVGAELAGDARVALVSATGSVRMGRAVAARCAPDFRRTLLELGGNNAAILMPSADRELALRAIAFAALGTAGQRCTTLRRLIVVEGVEGAFLDRLKAVWAGIGVGDPRVEGNLVGPLIDEAAARAMAEALAQARALGGVVSGGERLPGPGVYVRPALVEMDRQAGPVLEETFAPILYVLRARDLGEAIALNNGVSQGLSSAIFTRDVGEAEAFLAAAGSDCGIANVNIGTSGAEIGGAFGGEKATGGGRESGSDCWKAYMRRATQTVNGSGALPLAQGVRFDV